MYRGKFLGQGVPERLRGEYTPHEGQHGTWCPAFTEAAAQAEQQGSSSLMLGYRIKIPKQ